MHKYTKVWLHTVFPLCRKGRNATMNWLDKHILLGVTGGIAAYKAATLASRLTQAGAQVDVVMTPSACEFIRPLTFAAVTRRKVHLTPWESERKPEHIALAEGPDIAVIAPCTANTLAKLATGIADNLLTSVLLATQKPVLLAPAMNTGMWTAAPTQRNLSLVQQDGYHIIGPGTGHLACGDAGSGRMSEPEEIIAAIENILLKTDEVPRC